MLVEGGSETAPLVSAQSWWPRATGLVSLRARDPDPAREPGGGDWPGVGPGRLPRCCWSKKQRTQVTAGKIPPGFWEKWCQRCSVTSVRDGGTAVPGKRGGWPCCGCSGPRSVLRRLPGLTGDPQSSTGPGLGAQFPVGVRAAAGSHWNLLDVSFGSSEHWVVASSFVKSF